MKKIAVVTATRAEYGILIPLISAIHQDTELKLQLIVTGTHLSKKYGKTISFIKADGFPVYKEIPILSDGNTPYDISVTMANTIKGFAEVFRNDRPDMIIILGDRTEMLGVACAAMNEQIPIAHLHGGEITEGAVDDCIRHAITKMSYLHFASSESYRKRIIQMGEAPERVYNVGALSAENILHTSLLNEYDLRKCVGIPFNMPYCVVTFHPVTLETKTSEIQVHELCKAMQNNTDYFYLMTMANADADGDLINTILKSFAENNPTIAKFVTSLGMKRYLSALKYAAFILGNSSSGIIEAPVLGTPTVNIGDRQKGRLMAATIINCAPIETEITHAIHHVKSVKRIATLMYGDGNTSSKIIMILKSFLLDNPINLKKKFYNLEVSNENEIAVFNSGTGRQ